jgi:hypothetical protein
MQPLNLPVAVMPGYFYPAVRFTEIQPLLLRLLSHQIGEEVAHQWLLCFEPAQVFLVPHCRPFNDCMCIMPGMRAFIHVVAP